MRINHNIAAMNTYRQLTINNESTAKSVEKLSSGLRINRAADDAAGLAISEKMRGQIQGLDQASRNSQDGISLIQTAEGALQETESILQRMRELAVQAATDSYTNVDRGEIQKEIDQLVDEIDRIAFTTEFNTKRLLDGNASANEATTDSAEILTQSSESTKFVIDNTTVSGSTSSMSYYVEVGAANASGTAHTYYVTSQTGTTTSGTLTASGIITVDGVNVTATGAETGDSFGVVLKQAEAAGAVDNTLTLHIGANTAQTMKISMEDMTADALHVEGVKVDTQEAAEATITSVEAALRSVSSERAKLGAYQNRLEHTINNLGTTSENLSASESRIRDVDMASEMMEYTKNNILVQASQAMLAQANQLPQGVLQLLR